MTPFVALKPAQEYEAKGGEEKQHATCGVGTPGFANHASHRSSARIMRSFPLKPVLASPL